jgi:plasmid stabilization system protein ParE
MTYQLRLRPQVESDIEETALWYEERQAGLGGAFIWEVRQAINTLKSNPQGGSVDAIDNSART